jgi:hypothetical protein
MNLKKIIIAAASIITAIFTILGGLWAFENHYATNKKVDTEIERVEIQVAGAIQNQQIQNNYKFYQFMYDKLTQDMFEIRRQLRRFPEDRELRQDYQDVKRERSDVKRKMDLLMEKIQ